MYFPNSEYAAKLRLEGYLQGVANREGGYRDTLESSLNKHGMVYILNDDYLKKMELGEGHSYLLEVVRELGEKYGEERR